MTGRYGQDRQSIGGNEIGMACGNGKADRTPPSRRLIAPRHVCDRLDDKLRPQL
jgi:hypothetical protein